ELQKGVTNPCARRECPSCAALLFQQLAGFLIGLGHQDVGPVDDLLWLWLPAVLRACLAVEAGGFAGDIERRVGNAEAEPMTCGKLAGLAARPEGIGRRMRLLQRARPDRDRAELVMTALPAEGLRLGPRLEDQLHPFGGSLPRLGRIEPVGQVLLG